jgi:aerotaxis receptor
MANIHLEENSLLISVTNSEGLITYVNDDFIKYSGYSENELIGESQNIFRHPDMPEVIVSDLCKTIVDGKVWKGFLKNRCKDSDDYYWVFAIITKIISPDGSEGYLGIRSKPTYEDVEKYINKDIQ